MRNFIAGIFAALVGVAACCAICLDRGAATTLRAEPTPQRRILLNRRALIITETELKLIAALAIIGLSSRPNMG
jgi:hypothetical protein